MSRNIKRLPPASLFWMSHSQKLIRLFKVHEWKFGPSVERDGKREDLGQDLERLFLDAVRNRVTTTDKMHPILALSGGLDSRVVFAALNKMGFGFTSSTGIGDAVDRNDVKFAKQITELYGRNWKPIHLNQPDLSTVSRLVYMQEGGSPAFMASSVEHCFKLAQECGYDIVTFTGDGGNTVMYPLLPSRHLHSLDDILAMTTGTMFYFDIATVAKLLRLEQSEISASYRDYFAGLPEEEADWKYFHYKIFGRPYRFIMEGEDRTRFFFWIAAPFWSTPLVNLMLAVPDNQKRGYKLYLRMIRDIDPRVTTIPYAGTKVAVPFGLLPTYARINSFIYAHPSIHRSARALLVRNARPRYSSESIDPFLQRILTESSYIREHFDMPLLRSMLDAGLPRINYFLIATVLLRAHFVETDYRPLES